MSDNQSHALQMTEDQAMDPDVHMALQQHYESESLRLLRSIRAMLMFFTVLACLSIAGTIIGLAAMEIGNSN